MDIYKNTIVENELTRFFSMQTLKNNFYNIVFAVIVIIVAYFAIKFAKRAVDRTLIKFGGGNDFVIMAVKRTVKYIIVVAAIFLIFAKFNISLNAFFTIFSALLIAFGIAMKDFLSNIAKSIEVKTVKPFKEGDIIEVDSQKGRVEKVNFFYTYLLNENKDIILIPNSIIADKSIINYAMNKKEENKEETKDETKENREEKKEQETDQEQKQN